MRPAGIWLCIVLAGAGAMAARGRLEHLTGGDGGERGLLYLPNGKHLKLLSLGHGSLLADWLYIWAIQYYSEYERGDRYRYVEHVFGDVIAELDPHYIDPYWLGALIMIVEAHDLDAGLRLLDRGFANNPDEWILPYLAGWECYHAGRYERAADYLAAAAAVPGAPSHVARMRAGMVARAGDDRHALDLWRQLLADPRNDAATRAIAERQVRALRVRIDLNTLSSAVETFRRRTGRLPRSLVELVRAGVLSALPLDPDGNRYAYDPASGQVSSVADRLLGRTG